ncbi:hypothetical protein LSTR_LSTR002717 [Laodelphax striatellus]|uniref:MADF domain-containing protein n=1 Tax=Laodelphax striatellus TaxID=195883 RepID=A0A482X5B8_LAOST|nr:hypothetical protein LSTR_LSTR002717 [Laodelphax striatellus]
MFNFQKGKLISLIRDRPVLWDRTLRIRNDRFETKKAWVEVFKELIPGYEEMNEEKRTIYGEILMKKWTNIKDCYRRSEKNYRKAIESGKGRLTKKYVYSKKLQFLKINNMEECSTGDNGSDIEEIRFEDEDEDSEADTVECLQEVAIPCDTSTTCETPDANKFQKKEHAQLDFFVSNPTKAAKEKPDRHTSFFNGIIPSLQTFDDDEIVEFQLSVLQVLSDMKKRKKSLAEIQII